MSFYLDTSAIVSLFLEESRSVEVAALIADPAATIFVSDLCSGEFSAAISTAWRAKRIGRDEASSALADFDVWFRDAAERVLLTNDDLSEAIALVRQFDLKLLFPNALHIVLCQRKDAALVSGDVRQVDAARILGLVVEIV